jgi:hypothetical protein
MAEPGIHRRGRPGVDPGDRKEAAMSKRKVAVQHAIQDHGHQNTPGLKEEIRSLLRDET